MNQLKDPTDNSLSLKIVVERVIAVFCAAPTFGNGGYQRTTQSTTFHTSKTFWAIIMTGHRKIFIS